MLLQPTLIPACNSSNLAFLMVCSAYRLNKQGDSRQPCCTPFLILNQSVVPYRVLPVTSWPAYRFLRRQVRWPGIPISLRAFHSFSLFVFLFVSLSVNIHTHIQTHTYTRVLSLCCCQFTDIGMAVRLRWSLWGRGPGVPFLVFSCINLHKHQEQLVYFESLEPVLAKLLYLIWFYMKKFHKWENWSL